MQPNSIPVFPYVGSALPGNGEVVILFTTARTFTAGAPDNLGYSDSYFLQKHNIYRIHVSLQNDQAGTIKVYQSLDRGLNWVQVVPDTAVAASPANSTNDFDFLCEAFPDVKITWTNGVTPQTVFRVNVVGTEQRVVGN